MNYTHTHIYIYIYIYIYLYSIYIARNKYVKLFICQTAVIFCKSTSVTEASGRADSPQLSHLHSVAMTRQNCSTFSLVC